MARRRRVKGQRTNNDPQGSIEDYISPFSIEISSHCVEMKKY
jgi:hypothetical protein